MLLRRTIMILAVFSFTLAPSCQSPQPPGPTVTSSFSANPRPRSAKTLESPQPDVIAISRWDPSGKHAWAVSPACPRNELNPARPESIEEMAQAYLARKGLLPAKYHFCISRLNNDEWQATCIPARQYLNSPVTLVIASGKVRNHFFSDAADTNLDQP